MLYKRGNVWWYRFQFHGSEIRESAGTPSKTVARQIEFERRRGLEEGVGGIRRKRPNLFRVAAEQWLTVKRATLAPKSIRAEESNLKHLLPFFGGILTTDIEASDIARYQEQRKREKAAAGTINLEISTVRAILRRLGLWARLQPEVRMLPELQDVGRAISADEETTLLSACAESRSRALLPAVLLALNTGLRHGELTSLRWSQVDLKKKLLTVGRSKTEAGAGRKIPLNRRALFALSAWAKRFSEGQPEDFVFPSEKYGYRGAVYAINRAQPMGRLKEGWEAAKKRADITCRWHDLRHTFCTRLLEAGTAFPMIAAVMGWSAATTVRMAQRYGHVSTEALREVVLLLDRPGFQPEGAQEVAQFQNASSSVSRK